MRGLYAVFFEHYRLLPDRIGTQNPWRLAELLEGLSKNTDVPRTDYLDMFYGR